MIQHWNLSNFKSVSQASLPLAPLTMFAGANSSGKSSLLQSILLIAQTLSARAGIQPIILNGHLVKLGQLDDLRNSITDEKRITLGWTITPDVPEDRPMKGRLGHLRTFFDSVSCEVIVGLSQPESASEQLNPTLFEMKKSSQVREPLDQTIAQSQVRLVRKKSADHDTQSRDSARKRNRFTFDYQVELDDESAADLKDDFLRGEPFGCNLGTFLPSSLLVRFDEKAEIIRAIVGALTRTPRHRYERDPSGQNAQLDLTKVIELVAMVPELQSVLDGIDASFGESIALSELLDRLRRARLNLSSGVVSQVEAAAYKLFKDERGFTLTPLPGRSLDAAADSTREFFSNQVKYLGPLREEPKAIYPIQNTSDPQDVGLHGEHTAAVLHRNRYVEVQYLPTANFSDKSTSTEIKRVALEDAVFDWLEYLDVAKKVDTSDEGKFGYSLKVVMTGGSESHDLTHVGVGVSQVLPIVVMCLLAGRNTTVIIEQPELHLNPKVQTRLADFFLSMSMLQKQCLIETHSEYLINRLRLRSALAEGTTVSSLLKLYFVEKAGGFTTYRDVKVNEYGTILDWPKGFFDQNQREVEAIILAASVKG